MNNTYDVIIVGAGLVGLVLAAILVKGDFKVAVIDSQNIEPIALTPDQFELRVSAISLAASNIFKHLDLWQPISETNHIRAFEKMHVWDNLGRGQIDFDCTDIGTEALGYIIENAVMHNALLERLHDNPNATFYSKATTLGLRDNRESLTLELTSEKLTAPLIVGADGANSWVREYAHIGYHSWSYQHEALVTTVRTEHPHQKTAWQSFLPEGPLAFLPLSDDNCCSIVWSNSPFETKRLQKLNDSDFNHELAMAFEFRLGNVTKIAKTMSFPLTMRHAKNYVRQRVALIGDAAHTIHPLAGQGINLGFLDAAALAENITSSRGRREDWGDYLNLRRYERIRKGKNWLMIMGMDFFKRIFQSEARLTVNMRSFGLRLVNNMTLVKDEFIKEAAGLSKDLPMLARPKFVTDKKEYAPDAYAVTINGE